MKAQITKKISTIEDIIFPCLMIDKKTKCIFLITQRIEVPCNKYEGIVLVSKSLNKIGYKHTIYINDFEFFTDRIILEND